MGDKLTLKHLAPYLPYGLKIVIPYYQEKGALDLVKLSKYKAYLSNGGSSHLWQEQYIKNIKPIIRPLSDLTKEIEHNGERFVPYEFLVSKYACDSFIVDWLYLYKRNVISTEVAPYKISQQLFKWNFDVFGLIDKGLAIDINTLEGGRDE